VKAPVPNLLVPVSDGPAVASDFNQHNVARLEHRQMRRPAALSFCAADAVSGPSGGLRAMGEP